MVELYKHNLESYLKVKEVLRDNTKVLIEQATGTGKSYITMRLMQDDYKDYKKLYVVPKTAIRENLMLYPEWSGHNTDFMTYAKLTRLDINKLIQSYDLFIFDEVHHAGASVWGIPVKAIINSGKLCIGLTATPERCDGIDVSEALFDNIVVKGPDVSCSISTGIWSEFKYVLTVNKIRERLYEAKRKVDSLPACTGTLDIKAESEAIHLSDASSYTVRNIIQSNASDGVQKYLVFCSSRKQLYDIDDDIRDWFSYGNVTILKVDSTSGSKNVATCIKKFNDFNETGKILVLASVNILIEGLHITGVSGMILLRHTDSLPVFLQMIGRAMSVGNTEVPLIVDVADNLSMLRKVIKGTLTKEDTVLENKDIGNCKDKPTVMLSREVSIEMELLISMEEFIEKVNSINNDNIWTNDELVIMRRYYPDVQGRLNKTKVSIRRKAVEMGLVHKVSWTVEEDELLKAQYPVLGMSVSSLLCSKSKSEIRNRVRYLGLKYKNRWSFEEDEQVLRGHIPNGRTSEECIRRCEKLRRELL